MWPLGSQTVAFRRGIRMRWVCTRLIPYRHRTCRRASERHPARRKRIYRLRRRDVLRRPLMLSRAKVKAEPPKWVPIRRKTRENRHCIRRNWRYFQWFRRGVENCKTFMRRDSHCIQSFYKSKLLSEKLSGGKILPPKPNIRVKEFGINTWTLHKRSTPSLAAISYRLLPPLSFHVSSIMGG